MPAAAVLEVLTDPSFATAADPAARHRLHGAGTPWPEKNCYIDLWIELLQSCALEPCAMLAPALAVDFEGDQWTFLKPSFDELRRLYGLEVQELTLWRPPLEHVAEQLQGGRLVTLEVDAWWLPDTAATDYRQQHTKTTIAIHRLDRAGHALGYFHNAGRHALGGEDFDGLFHQAQPQALAAAAGVVNLAPYAEFIRLDRLQRRPETELRRLARALVAEHLQRRPADNPVTRFATRWAAELPDLQAAGLPHYHRWAFSNLRQLGSAAELGAAALVWCWPDEAGPGEAAAALQRIARHTQGLILKGARSVALGRALDAAAALQPCADDWALAMARMDAHPGQG